MANISHCAGIPKRRETVMRRRVMAGRVSARLTGAIGLTGKNNGAASKAV